MAFGFREVSLAVRLQVVLPMVRRVVVVPFTETADCHRVGIFMEALRLPSLNEGCFLVFSSLNEGNLLSLCGSYTNSRSYD